MQRTQHEQFFAWQKCCPKFDGYDVGAENAPCQCYACAQSRDEIVDGSISGNVCRLQGIVAVPAAGERTLKCGRRVFGTCGGSQTRSLRRWARRAVRQERADGPDGVRCSTSSVEFERAMAIAWRRDRLLRWGAEGVEDAECLTARIGDVALLLWIWASLAMGVPGWRGSWEAFVACRRLWCVWQGRLARRCAGRRLCAARRSPGSGCKRRRRLRRSPTVVMVQEPLSATEVAALECLVSDNVVESQACRRQAVNVCAAQFQAHMLACEGDDGRGVFSGEERRAWLEPCEVEPGSEMECAVDVGWQVVHGRYSGAAQQDGSRLLCARDAALDSGHFETNFMGHPKDCGGGSFMEEQARAFSGGDDHGWSTVRRQRYKAGRSFAGCLPVGPCFDMMQDVRLKECGSQLGDASRCCFQVAVLHSFEGNIGFARSVLCARLQHACGNDVGTSFNGDGVARSNFEETACALRDLQLGVWVVFARNASVLQRGYVLGKLYVGCPGAKNVGAVAWFKEGHAVCLEGGHALRQLLRSLVELGRCPGSYGSVGAPKKRKFRGGDAKAMGAKGHAVRYGMDPGGVAEDGGPSNEEAAAPVEANSSTGSTRSARGVLTRAAASLIAGSIDSKQKAKVSESFVPAVGIEVGIDDAGGAIDEPVASTSNREVRLVRGDDSDDPSSGSSGSGVLGGGSDVSSWSAPPSDGETQGARHDSSGRGAACSVIGGSADDLSGQDCLRDSHGIRGKHRRRRREQVEEVWKRFTPKHIDEQRCLARTYAGGKGDQCRNRRRPGEKYCRSHAYDLKHGHVYGPIPKGKLQGFLNKEFRSNAQATKAETDAEAIAKTGKASRKDQLPGKGKWYTRHVMWLKAAKRGVDNLADLDALAYHACLQEVDEHFRMHPGQVRKGKSFKVEKGRGPQGNEDRARLGSELESLRESYNGVDGGEVFKWYRPQTFARYLSMQNVDSRTCSERQCEDALRATTIELGRYPQDISKLKAYAGPQCFPQLYDDSRLNANMEGGAPVDSDRMCENAVSRAMKECWLRCGERGCQKWRLIEPGALPSLTGEQYKSDVECSKDPKWKEWLEAAQNRYEKFLERHQKQRSDNSKAIVEEEGEEDEESDGFDERPVYSQPAHGDGEGLVCGECDSSVAAPPDLWADDEEWAPSESDGSGDSRDAADLQDADVRAELEEVKRMLGTRHGGFNAKDAKVLETLVAEEEGAPDGHEQSRKPVARALGRKSAWQGMAFRCSMLVARDGDVWRPMSCEDEDDFHALKTRVWSLEQDFHVGDQVELCSKDAEVPPWVISGWARTGKVQKLRVKRPDPEDLTVGEKTRAGRRKKFRHYAADCDAVVLSLEEDRGKGWNAEAEVHYEQRHGGEACVEGSLWHCIENPWSVLSSTRKHLDMRQKLERRGADLKAVGRGKKQRARAAQSKAVKDEHNSELLSECLVLPVSRLPYRGARYDVCLRESSLRAVQAMHTILTRMVMFSCSWCRERFPTFHPAYMPPPWLEKKMTLLRKGADGVAVCNIAVASWDDVPTFWKQGEEGGAVASQHEGVCLRCHKDIEKQVQRAEKSERGGRSIVPKFSYQNIMDPMYNFPFGSRVQELLDMATTTEAMLVALEHMQVHYATVGRTGLRKFRRNVISFPQDVVGFAKRMGMLEQYKVGDRVNSLRGPINGHDLSRPCRRVDDKVTSGRWGEQVREPVSEAELQQCGVDENGCLVYAAEVVAVDGAQLTLRYDIGGTGVEWRKDVTIRVTMPWHPKYLKGDFSIMLRRGVKPGVVLEGLEVRWGLVRDLLEELIKTHRWYDRRLFDVASPEQIAREYAPKGSAGEPKDLFCAQDFAEAGFDVRFVDDRPGVEGATESDVCVDVIEGGTFEGWLERSSVKLGSLVLNWWLGLASDETGVGGSKTQPDETAYDLFARMRVSVQEEAEKLSGVGMEDLLPVEQRLQQEWNMVVGEGGLSPWLVVWWLRREIGEQFQVEGEGDLETLEEQVRMEISVLDVHDGSAFGRAVMEKEEGGEDPAEALLKHAQSVVHGWPAVDAEPTAPRAAGRFPKSFPLEFPMGIADLYDERPVPVSPAEWVQHMLRYFTGQFLNSRREHRVVWAMVNTVLLSEAAGKGAAVHRNVLRRQGYRLVGRAVLTASRLRDMIQNEDSARSIVNQIQVLGRDVRSTPMQMSFEQKKLSCAVKHLSWRPPWVESLDGSEQEAAADYLVGEGFENTVVADKVGLGRTPSFWATLNCRYNAVYDIHRLNVGLTEEQGKAVLASFDDDLANMRFRFVQDAPDIAALMVALRSELHMRVVMPTVVPHSKELEFRVMARFETGGGGNPHWHLLAAGGKNPVLKRVVADGEEGGAGDVPARAEELPDASSVNDNDVDLFCDDGRSGDAVDLLVGRDGADVPVLQQRLRKARGSCSAAVSLPAGQEGVADGKGRGRQAGKRASAAARELRKERKTNAADFSISRVKQDVKAFRDYVDDFGAEEQPQKKTDMETVFWSYFGDKVSEWNPCYSDDGVQRFFWDEEVAAHDVEVDTGDLGEGLWKTMQATWVDMKCPERVRLRCVLDAVFETEQKDGKLDLEPVKRLVALLVRSSGRHTKHSNGSYNPPVLGKDPCARGDKKCPYCRYGFPHERMPRGRMRLKRVEGQEGQWTAHFPRNDGLCCSYEPHVLLANLSNVDWRPILNLWAVMEYITKYATKAQKGSRTVGEVLRSAVDEVCKYVPEDGTTDLLRRSLQKCYSRTIGERDYGIFEAMHLGLRLPVVLELMPVVSLNTMGTRKFKSYYAIEKEREEGVEDPEATYDSKLDQFDKRREMLFADEESDIQSEHLRCLSLYEFHWKYYVRRKKILPSPGTVCLNVTPSLSSDCANVTHPRHETYARVAVVAFWRMMPTKERHELANAGLRAKSYAKLLLGGTVFKEPSDVAGCPGRERFLGVRDLVFTFDGREKTKTGKEIGWALALMEMLVDPVLKCWVPCWLHEQYERWNPSFKGYLKQVFAGKQKPPDNKAFLRMVYRAMVRHDEQKVVKETAEKVGGDGDSSEAGGGDKESSSDEDPDRGVAKAVEETVERICEGLPQLSGDAADDVGVDDDWARAPVAARLSAAGPASAAEDVAMDGSVGLKTCEAAPINPEGYCWVSCVGSAQATSAQQKWEMWKDKPVADDGDGVDRASLDEWQRFAHDIVVGKAEQRDRAEQEVSQLRGYKPLRLLVSGSAGAGKSRTLRACVQSRREVMKKFTKDSERVKKCCILAAPTGCAAFQMKYGATTLHRAFGVRVGFCGPWTNRQGKAFDNMFKRLSLAKFAILDEFSMIGRMFLGKVLYKVRDVLGRKPKAFGGDEPTMHGIDVMLCGHEMQAKPIGDDPLYKEGKYTGKSLNKPRGAERPVDAPEPDQLVQEAELFAREFQDVVLLRRVHRTIREGDEKLKGMTSGERAVYLKESEHFQGVMQRLSDLSWTEEDHAWLSQRNRSALARTQQGEREVQAFHDIRRPAPVLTDTRKPSTAKSDGHLGAEEMNALELEKCAKERGVPILRIGGHHDKPGKAVDLRPEKMDADEFKGLDAWLHLCVGARVLLTQNLWVEAGLMNGALGWVRGFQFPEGFDPRSKDPKLRSPVFVIVQFDNVNLGFDTEPDASGKPQRVRRSFFPDMGWGVDDDGIPIADKCVPIYHVERFAATEEGVSRKQFPLTLAWALTHWKAQGMTLDRVRVALGAFVAQSLGIGYVCCTRVKHIRDLMFELDLPDYETFQKARGTESFKMRRRFELRLQARASRTILEYASGRKGFVVKCEADPWEKEGAEVALQLLKALETTASMRRCALKESGRPTDKDAWLWGDEEPDLGVLLDQAAEFVAGTDALWGSGSPSVEERLHCCRCARDRLLRSVMVDAGKGVELHVPAVREALGCLIPPDLHPRLDRGSKAKKNPGAVAASSGVELTCGHWKVQVYEERNLKEGRPMQKGMLEFFLQALRCVSTELGFGVYFGNIGLAKRLGSEETALQMRACIAGWTSWSWKDREACLASTLFAVPVCRGDWDWSVMFVTSAEEGGSLGSASELRYAFADRYGNNALGERVAEKLEVLLCHGERGMGGAARTVVMMQDCHCNDKRMSSVFALGEILVFLASREGESTGLVRDSVGFVGGVQDCLSQAFAFLSAEADARDVRDVSKVLRERAECLKLLGLFLQPPTKEEVAAVSAAAPLPCAARPVDRPSFEPLRLLTWNVCGDVLACQAPADTTSWNASDKRAAVQREILRLKPDVVCLQECVSRGPLSLLQGYALVGAVASSHGAGYVQLYVVKRLAVEVLSLGRGLPGVACRVDVNGLPLYLLGVHLTHSLEAKTERRKQLRDMLSAFPADDANVVVFGDLNVYREEGEELCDALKLSDADYASESWNPRVNRFFKELQDFSGSAQRFDRFLFCGAVFACACLVGQYREFRDGCEFFLSDHFAVLSFVDVHEAYLGKSGVGVIRSRRAALGSARTVESVREVEYARDRERVGREQAALMRTHAADRIREATLKVARKAARKVEEQRKQLLQGAFGTDTLFGPTLSASFPGVVAAMPWDVAVPCLEGLPAVKAVDVWQGCVRYPRYGGLWNKGGLCYVSVVAQVLLRIPAVVVFLDRHASLCSRGLDRGCVTCLLQGTRQQMGMRLEPLIAAQRGYVEGKFRDGGQHDAVEFLRCLLNGMRDEELRASPQRAALYEGDGVHAGFVVTHVERIFSFLEETRVQCEVCGKCCSSRAVKDLISLPLPEQGGSEITVSDLFLMYFSSGKVHNHGVTPASLSCCGKGAQILQRRVLRWPNVLLVQVGRHVGGQVEISRQHVRAEVRLELPGLGTMELAAVVYHAGRQMTAGHYTCACRGTDGMFWYFDDLTRQDSGCRRLSGDVEQFLPRRVYLMVYVRPHGASEFAGMGGVPQSVRDASGGIARWCQDGLPSVEPPATPRAPSASLSRMSVARDQGAFAQGQVSSSSISAAAVACQASDVYSAHSTPVKSPPEKIRRVCPDCKYDYEDDGDARLSTPMSVETPVRSPLAKCPRCGPSPGAMGGARVSIGVEALPSVPAWPSVSPESAGTGVRDSSSSGMQLADASPSPGAATGGVSEVVGALRDMASASPGTASSLCFDPKSADQLAWRRELGRIGSVQTFVLRYLSRAYVGEDVLGRIREVEGMRALLGQPWCVEWEGWADLAKDLWSLCDLDDSAYHQIASVEAMSFLRRFLRVAGEQLPPEMRWQTDLARLAELRELGWDHRRGEVWGRNDCLADSLLQLLIFHGVLATGITASERCDACEANRNRCWAVESLRPRQANRAQWGAFLELDRHAEATVLFFLQHFRAQRGSMVLPGGGISVRVFSRFDDVQWLAGLNTICICRDVQAAVESHSLEFALFNWQDPDGNGCHFDPLFRGSPGGIVIDVESEGGQAGGAESIVSLESGADAGSTGGAGAEAGAMADPSAICDESGSGTQGWKRFTPPVGDAAASSSACVPGMGGKLGIGRKLDVNGAGALDAKAGAVAEVDARWKRFTPKAIDSSRCLARIWGDGVGGQCRDKPVLGGDLCKKHSKEGGLSHGRVDGDIPDRKFKEFVKFEEARMVMSKRGVINRPSSVAGASAGGGVGEQSPSIATGRLSRAGFEVTPSGAAGLVASSSATGEELSGEVCRASLQQWLDKRRATGDKFDNSAACSPIVCIGAQDVERIRLVFGDDQALGDELGKLLGVALGQKWDMRRREKARLVEEFRKLLHMQRIQGSGQVGRQVGQS